MEWSIGWKFGTGMKNGFYRTKSSFCYFEPHSPSLYLVLPYVSSHMDMLFWNLETWKTYFYPRQFALQKKKRKKALFFYLFILFIFFGYPKNPADQTKRETKIVYDSQ